MVRSQLGEGIINVAMTTLVFSGLLVGLILLFRAPNESDKRLIGQILSFVKDKIKLA
jgi:hypothetical protein